MTIDGQHDLIDGQHVPLVERVEFAVYADVVEPWLPADHRRLLRVGCCALHDLDLQQMADHERVFVIERQPADAGACVVSIKPYPRLVAKPGAA